MTIRDDNHNRIEPEYYVHLRKGAEVILADDVHPEPFVSFSCHKMIVVDEGTHIAPGASIVDHDHRIPENAGEMEMIKEGGIAKEVHIGKYCWIGANAVVLKGVTLGDGCIVGAGAVVTKSFPSGSIVVGNPARLLRKRW